MTLSAADRLTLSGLRAEVLDLPADSLVLLHLAAPTPPEQRGAVRGAILRLADQWDVEPQRIVVLEPGVTLETLPDAALRWHGLRRVTDAG